MRFDQVEWLEHKIHIDLILCSARYTILGWLYGRTKKDLGLQGRYIVM